ncbi:FtsK/SpoIIIE domain-containing protein [Brevundimonas sp.]|uniref:FtsK/SpoIIIE domain-containing protein n=1 Tax=Brevundimonas sp. TaxID=1871086 RepID=UPI003D6C9C16
MVQKVHLSEAERSEVQAVIRSGLRAKVDQWTVARLALARSLQEPTSPSPELFPPNPQRAGGTELHAAQLIGEGKGQEEDFSDAFRAVLSVYEGVNLFADEDAFHDVLQRHVRRGLQLIRSEWTEGQDFPQYLLQQLFFGATPGEEDGEVGSAEMAGKVEAALAQLGVGANVLEVLEGPRLTRLTLGLDALDDLDRLRRGLAKLAFALGFGQETLTTSLAPGERRIHLLVPRPLPTWKTVGWSDVAGVLDEPPAAGFGLPVVLGSDILSAPFAFDLAEAPHLFVGGTTGSGKSMCLHAILLSLLKHRERPDLLLIDPKAVEFSAYAALPNLRSGGVITSPEQALVALEDLVSEMDERQAKLARLDARNIAEANSRGANLRRIVAVLDELGDLFMTKREIEGPLIRLAQKARSSGIHLVLATQRPEAATFPGLLRSNIPSRVALTVQKAAESRIILDEGGAEGLLMRGDMLVKLAGRPTLRAHGCRIDPADIAAAVRAG